MSLTRVLLVALAAVMLAIVAAELRRPAPVDEVPAPGPRPPDAGPGRPQRSQEVDRALAVGRTYRSGRAGLEVTERTERYLLDGRTAPDLYAAMDSLSPLVNGRRHHASTDVETEPRVSTIDGVTCDPRATTLRVTLTVTLPEWRPPRSADAGLRERWRRFREALERHERGHQDIGLYFAEAMLREARALTATDCAELQRALSSLRAAGELARIQRRYDDETRARLRPVLPRL